MPRKRRSISSAEDSDDDFDDDVKHPQRNAANARERARMRVLSKAFCKLKTTLPWVPADTKLSKLDTLRLATSYIAHLRAVLMDEPPPGDRKLLTWPFTFQQQPQRPDSSTDASSLYHHHQNQQINNDEQPPWSEHPSSQHPHIIRDKNLSYYY